MSSIRFGVWALVHGSRAALQDPEEPYDASWARNRALIDADVKRDTKKMSTYEDFDLGTANNPGEGATVAPFRTVADGRRAYLLKFVDEQLAK